MAIGLITTPATWVNRTVVTPVWLQNVQDTLNELYSLHGASVIFGDGSDGDVTLNSGPVNASGDTFGNNLTYGASAVLNTVGTVIYAKTSITINAGATFQCIGAAGANGSGANGGVGGGVSATPVGPHIGGVGRNGGGVVDNGSPITRPLSVLAPGACGSGGNGGDGTGSGGAPAGPGFLYQDAKSWKRMPFRIGHNALFSKDFGNIAQPYMFQGGSGGCGGRAATATNGAGGGGQGGGLVIIVARRVIVNGAFTVNVSGGAGGNGAGAGAGGGGGGGGGAAILIYQQLTGVLPTVTAAGGAAGTGGGTGGLNGSAGSAGLSSWLTFQVGA